MINYRVVYQESHIPGSMAEGKYYPRILNRKNINLDRLAEMIEQQTTFSKGDVKGVVEALTENLTALMLENYSVKLGDLGTFSLHLKPKGSLTEDKAVPSAKDPMTVAFRPSSRVRKALRTARFKKHL